MTAALDWSAPIEAVHEDGRVVAVSLRDSGMHRKGLNPDDDGDYWLKDGAPCGPCVPPDGDTGLGWRIRNVATLVTQPDIPPALVERMVALVRSGMKLPAFTTPIGHPIGAFFTELSAISADLPQPADPDEVEAQKLNNDSPYDLTGLEAEHAARNVRYIGATILAAIKRGRALAKEGK